MMRFHDAFSFLIFICLSRHYGGVGMKEWEDTDKLRWGWSPEQVLLLEWGIDMEARRWKGP